MSDAADITDAIKKRDGIKLRELAGKYSDLAVISQSQQDINLSIITYCMHKIYNKVHFQEKTTPLSENVLKLIGVGDLDGVIKAIETFDKTNGLFQNGLVDKARVKIGSRIYTQGISISQAASLLNVGVSDIQNYVGDTKYHEKLVGKSVKERLNDARNVFKDL